MWNFDESHDADPRSDAGSSDPPRLTPEDPIGGAPPESLEDALWPPLMSMSPADGRGRDDGTSGRPSFVVSGPPWVAETSGRRFAATGVDPVTVPFGTGGGRRTNSQAARPRPRAAHAPGQGTRAIGDSRISEVEASEPGSLGDLGGCRNIPVESLCAAHKLSWADPDGPAARGWGSEPVLRGCPPGNRAGGGTREFKPSRWGRVPSGLRSGPCFGRAPGGTPSLRLRGGSRPDGNLPSAPFPECPAAETIHPLRAA